MRYHSTVAVGSPALRLASVLAMTGLLAAAATGAVLAGAALLAGPAVVPPPALGSNGLIAYDSNGDIMVADADGTNPRTFLDRANKLSSPTWSRDGTRWAFFEETSDGKLVRVIDADGGGDVDLTHGVGPASADLDITLRNERRIHARAAVVAGWRGDRLRVLRARLRREP